MGGGGLISNRVCVSYSLTTFHIFLLFCIQRLSERGIGYVIFVLSIPANVMVDVKMGRSRGKGGRGKKWGEGGLISNRVCVGFPHK